LTITPRSMTYPHQRLAEGSPPVPHPMHQIYPYLQRKMMIDRPNQIWCADITYIPMRRGFLYLVAVMDWSTRKVLS
jgi:putative transposase